MVFAKNGRKAAATINNAGCFLLDHAYREIAKRTKAKTPLPNSSISAGSGDNPVVSRVSGGGTIIGHNLPGMLILPHQCSVGYVMRSANLSAHLSQILG